MAVTESVWRPGDPLDALEQLMLERAANGEFLERIDSNALHSLVPANQAEQHWIIRAAVLRHLLTGTEWALDPKGVRLRGLRISGLLDLEAAAVRCPLWLEDCDLTDSRPIALDFATIPLLILARCRLPGISGNTLSVAANLSMEGSLVTKHVNLNGAHIGVALDCKNSVFESSVLLSGAQIGGAMMFGAARIGADEKGDSLVCNGMNLRLSAHLPELNTEGAVVLARADIGGELICREAHFGANTFGNSLRAPGARIRGAVHLTKGFSSKGTIWLAGASVGGQFRCDSAHIGADSSGNSLIFDGMRIGGSLNLEMSNDSAFTAKGAVRLTGAEISGSVSCRGAEIGADSDQNSLIGDEMKVKVALLLDGGFTASGSVRLSGAEIEGQLSCKGGQITGTDQDGNSIVATGVKVGGPTYLNGGFSAAGAVELSGADINGLLSLSGSRLGMNGSGSALVCSGMRAGRNLLIDDATFDGAMWVTGAIIGDSFACRGTRLGANADKFSLVAIRLKASGDVLLDRLLSAGAVLVPGADIGGRLCCRGAKLDDCDADGDALNADGARIGGSVFLSEGFIAAGAVQLSYANISGSLHCSGARLGVSPDHNALIAQQMNVTGGVLLDQGFTALGAVSLRGASIERELRWEPGKPASGEVNLEGTRTRQLIDDWPGPQSRGHWPANDLRIAGFSYDGLAGARPATVDQRLNWIRSQYVNRSGDEQTGDYARATSHAADAPSIGSSRKNDHLAFRAACKSPFVTQPYKQLADVYRRAGQDDEARTVEIAMRRDLRRYGNLSRPARSLNWLLDVTIRYGFETTRALAGIVVLYVIVFLALLYAQRQGNLIAPSNVQNASLHPAALHCVTGYPCFYPAGYAFDLVVPLINIHQAEFWEVNGHHHFGWPWVLGSWTATALGWFLATLLVVGYSGLARQE